MSQSAGCYSHHQHQDHHRVHGDDDDVSAETVAGVRHDRNDGGKRKSPGTQEGRRREEKIFMFKRLRREMSILVFRSLLKKEEVQSGPRSHDNWY